MKTSAVVDTKTIPVMDTSRSKHHSIISRLKAVFLLICLGGVLFLALALGRYPITPVELFTTLYCYIIGADHAISSTTYSILFEVRLPRILAAMLVGAALSTAGTAFQGVFKNPLVSPDVLGVSTGAGFGAAIAIMLSWGMLGIHLSAFVFGLIAVMITYKISKLIKQGDTTLSMVLTGLLISTIFSSLISLLKTVADPFNKLPAITFWLMGGLSSCSHAEIKLVVLPILLGIIPLYVFRWRLNILSFGDEEAQALGVNTSQLRLIVIICATVMTSAAVSISGMIGWVGLVIPHLARALVGPNYKALLPVSVLIGSTYLLLVDTLARVLLPMEIPLGILTALIGAPFFIYLLTRSRRGWI